ncbi:duboraya isoform X2 [Notolabrus celidotus]|uniref:duboraya isoform X2 n=1 Tax=Notolabrus celidotus TaxID=1203425 RepID=UPI00148FFBC0|nr:duboraya isoform X2 [Notolabrus celidotus]
MEEEAPARCSVAELAGRFKGSAPPHDAGGQETEKPVRRRPPRSLQLPKTHADNHEPAGVPSSVPVKAKRNSALIEKLQANLALSPTALLPSPKSPGFRLLPPAFPSPSSGSAPVTTVTPTPSTPTPISPVVASPLTKEEGPATFEAPPTAAEGSILSNINKGRARHSIRRRPPSRRSRKSSSGDDVNNTIDGGDTCLSSPNEPKDETKEKEGEGEKKEVKPDEVTEEKTETKNETQKKSIQRTTLSPERNKIEEKEETNWRRGGRWRRRFFIRERREEEEEKEEKNSAEKHKEESTETPTNTDSREEEKSQVIFPDETVCQSPAS